MASHQPEATRQRRSAQGQARTSANSTARARSPSQTRSLASEDSQTVLLGPARREAPSQISWANEDSAGPDLLHCWICLADEPAAERETRRWKAPCSCKLTAHEECLFQWIASQKDDNVYCPQCKTEIKIAQSRNLVVSCVKRILQIADYCLVPAAATAICGITYSGLLIYGANAAALVFGQKEATEMFRLTVNNGGSASSLSNLIRCLFPFFPQGNMDMNYFATLPLIGPVLVLSRFRIADKIFPFLPVAYSALTIVSRTSASAFLQWPPSPGLTLASLPFFRLIYNESYAYCFKDLEKKWDQAVQRQPREGETAEDVAREAGDDQGRHIDIGIEIVAVQDDEDDAQHPQDVIEVAEEAEAPAQVDVGGAPDARPEAINPNLDVLERRFSTVSGDGVLSAIFGALSFPAISHVMGDLIRYSLPAAWTRAPPKFAWARKSLRDQGFFQTQFGRSVAGGCLFIVLKDAVMLYYKWQRAKHYSSRTILDHRESPPGGRA